MPCVCELDGVRFELDAPFDFGFLERYGRVFRVFDDQDSGNICFGLERGGVRRFVKFAGARTRRGSVPPEQAIANLRACARAYADLRHECLIELLEAGEQGGGYALVFEWTDAVCMGRMYPESHARFMAMPCSRRMEVFAEVQRFFAHVARQGYVAIDFYDGSIMYDFERGRTVICDIDFFRRTPCVNDMGRMWGSARFQAPEEYRLGAPLDEITNVYTLGATAFALLAGFSRAAQDWPLSPGLYAVAQRAVSPERGLRPGSIEQFRREWRAACGIPG